MACGSNGSNSWNIPSSYVALLDSDENLEWFTALTRVINAKAPSLSDDKEISNFIKTHNLQHGDVINLNPDYRYSDCYIVNKDPENNIMGWIRNPDDAAAGYLTVPEKILQHVDDFITKYKNIITNEDICTVNFHPSPKDKYITTLFGENHPFAENWDFDIGFGGDESPEFINAKPKDKDWSYSLDVFMLNKVDGLYSSEEAVEYFTAERTKFKIKVSLTGEKLNEYKSKYGSDSSSLQWLYAKPDLPKLWSICKGQCLMSSDKEEWEWILEGPEYSRQEAQVNLEEFLQGFPYNYIQQPLPI